jgi:hypothetical protein
MTKIFDISTAKGMQQADRFKAMLNNKYASVTVYTIGLYRVQVVGRKPIGKVA